ncbi:MAG: hypothetical protein H7039_19230 [Bryobacteraceae bacterium]|nr:hypothetical protein [Bryobacteraceae bacterium]
MKILKTIILIAASVLAVNAQVRPMGDGMPKPCYTAANNSANQWKAQGKSPAEIEKLFQTALAKCSGADSAMAAIAGTANVDYARFGRAMLSDNMPTNLYLALVKDRSRKLRLSRQDTTWALAFLQGDTDGDLVPNSKDSCAGTPDLTPTDDHGCTLPGPLPPAPSAQSVKKAKSGLGVLTSPACDGAPVPEQPLALSAHYESPALTSLVIKTTRVTNQPAGCLVFYEFQVRFWFPTSPALPSVDAVELLFRNSENVDMVAHAIPQDVFRTTAADIGSRKRLFDLTKVYAARGIRVRAVNANGISSAWSEEKKTLVLSEAKPCTIVSCY